MALRKSTVYFFVIVFLALWFGLIIYLSYDDKHLKSQWNAGTLHRPPPNAVQLYAIPAPRPDSSRLAAGQSNSLLIVLRNRLPAAAQSLLLPFDEFSAVRVQVRALGATAFNFDELAGDPHAGRDPDKGGTSAEPHWHTATIMPGQSIAKEIVLPKKALPRPGDYEVILTCITDDFSKLEGRVAPIDRESLVINLSVTQVITVPAEGEQSPAPPAAHASNPPAPKPSTPDAPAPPTSPAPAPAPR